MTNIDENSITNNDYEKELILQVKNDYLAFRQKRFALEKQWELNIDFFEGRQYSDISPKGEIVEWDKEYYWQSREVFNHIAPLIETRLAKFACVRPVVSVRPSSDDDDETQNAKIAESLLKSVFQKISFNDTVSEVTRWSELCGTGFYKIAWDKNGGEKLGVIEGGEVFQGEAVAVSVSPFEIFPENLSVSSIEEQNSIIHAYLSSVSAVKKSFGVSVVPDNLTLTKHAESDAVVVIEKYSAPTDDKPNGELIIVAGNSLLHYGALPFINSKNGKRGYPFIKQVASSSAGAFFGTSVIERLIPVQRAFNAVKNRKHEFMNRITMGVLAVEDGSIDINELTEDGLSPGKILVYRQGSTPPQMMDNTTIPEVFEKEEEKLLNEFVIISGVSDVMSSKTEGGVSSGTALEILVEQDNERLLFVAEDIRNAYLKASVMILKLYKQFLTGVKAVKDLSDDDKNRVYYVDKSVITADDVYLDSENELMFSPRQKKEILIKLYTTGLLFDENGKLPEVVKEKLLTLLGYKALDSSSGLCKLHQNKARAEHTVIINNGRVVDSVDNHAVHIEEHTRYYLGEFENLTENQIKNLLDHVALHQNALSVKS